MPTYGGVVVPTGTEAEGRRTLKDVVDELAAPVNSDDSTIRRLAGDAFRAAVRKYNRKGNWPWEHRDEEITITANTSLYTVTGSIKKPLAMHFLDQSGGTRDQRINYMEYDKFLENYDLNINSEPYIYTIPNFFETGQIRFWPKPSSNDVAMFTYYRVTPAPKVESEAIEIPDMALEAYMAEAWYEFMKRLPAAQRPFPITVALSDKKDAFREISMHVTAPSDRSRDLNVISPTP